MMEYIDKEKSKWSGVFVWDFKRVMEISLNEEIVNDYIILNEENVN